MSAATLIRNARRSAGLTQADLARRIGASQPVVARLERPGANPTVETLDRVLRATGRRLRLDTGPYRSSIDESLVRKQLELSPGQRIQKLESMYREARKIALAGARARGELE